MNFIQIAITWSRKLFGIFPKITSDILIYGVGGSLAQIVSVGSVVFITRILSADEYGAVDVVNATIGYFTTLITLNIASGLMRHYTEAEKDGPGESLKLVSSLVWFTAGFGGLIVLVGILFSPKISLGLFGNTSYSTAINLGLMSLPFLMLNNIFMAIIRMKRQPAKYLIINIFFAVTNFLFILLFIIPLGFRIEGIFLAQLVSGVIVMLVSGWQCRELIGLSFSKKWFSSMAAYGIPKMPGSLFQWGMSSVNRLLLTQYTTTAQIALYSIALKPGKLMDLAVSSFSLAWIPILMTNIDSPSFHGKLDKALRYYVFTVILFSAALTSYAPEIIRILAPAEYQSAAKMVGILSLRQAIRGLGYILSIGIVKSKKTYFDSISAGIGVAFTIGISLVLMPFIGIYGAIIADILGQTVHTGLIYYFSNRLKKISWQFSPIFFAIGGFLLLYLLTILFSFPNPYLDAIYRTTLFGLFILYVFVVVDRGVILKRIWQSITQNFRKQNLE